MLETLRIQNYALIDDLEVEFSGGFNVLTGETGAGKSIIVGALNLALGARASNEVVREGARQAKVDAAFRIRKPSKRLADLLGQRGIEIENGELILSRVVTAEGRSRGYVQGSLVPIGVLDEIGDELVDMHGQHEHQSLLKTDRQLDLLDGFAGTEQAVEEVGERVGVLRELERTIGELETVDRERIRRVEFLRYEANEIDMARLQPGEEEELKTRRTIITNAEQIFTLVSHARSMLYEGEEVSAVIALDSALSDLAELAEIDSRFRPLMDQLTGARSAVDDVTGEIRSYADRLEFDPNELDNVNERLDVINNLKRKYGNSVEAILEYREKCMGEILDYDSRDKLLAEKQLEHKKLIEDVERRVSELSEKRKAAARKLDKRVTSALQELGMKEGCFETQIEPMSLSAKGIDRVEFLLAANPGEKTKPLRQVASGGEISRIMLALKAVFAQADKIPTLIFDEIDAGVGGHIARKVADKLTELSASHQTVCITHIAQIAAAGQSHHHVEKSVEKGRTNTRVSRIEGDARVEEIARLLDGSVSKVSLSHARSLLESC